MTQQMFEDLVGQPPPSTVDVDAIIRDRTRRRRIRQAPMVMAAVAVVAVGATIAGFGHLGTGTTSRDDVVVGKAPAGGTKIRLVVDTAEGKAKSAEELTKAYDEAVKKAVRGAEWKDGKPPRVTDEEAAPPAEFIFGATLIVDGKPGALVIQIENAGEGPDDLATFPLNCDNPDGHCKMTEGPNGEKLVVRRWDYRDGNWQKGDVYTNVTVGLGENRTLNLESHQDLLTEKQISAIVSDLASRIE
ncbi:hypothetical protein [Cryptosporangium arvum]|uniref:Uncharacterized protein n=1 Tax=Cryptosporangium arvum DSM 44712 TaxID=927661 RepID=A0A010YQ85_9ACTN|nr:hypothetical protein [Cryptosporangium arvum]EXG82350.1 hypothetical protein CryarDRAFT_3526 [Cryptosporangium arvum DSM 44712]